MSTQFAQRKTRNEIVEILKRRVNTVMYELPPIEVTQTLALHMSINPHLLNFIATSYVQRIKKVSGRTLEEQLALVFADLFLLPMRVEMRTEKLSGDTLEGTLYLFGFDQKYFAISTRPFRASVTAHAALMRLLNEPGQMPDGSSFGNMVCEVDNSEMRYSNFGFNATFNAVFSRFSLLCALCVSLSATSSILQAKFAADNDHRVMRVLVHGALTRLVDHISKPDVRHNKPHITDDLVHQIHQLIALCENVETFHSSNIMSLALKNYQTVCRKHKVRLSVN
jgi:hypothetical protein